MKSNVVMTRKMGEFEVLQRTSDGYFDANNLLIQWNSKNDRRRMDDFLKSKKTKEFIDTIEINEAKNLHSNNQAVTIIKGKKGNKGQEPNKVYMHPYLFIDFSMWINPQFKYDVIRFVYDELIKNRHLAGDNYNKLTAAIAPLQDVNYPQVAKSLNWIVFNKHHKDIRNTATHAQLDELHRLEEKLAFAVDMGLIKNYPELITTMRKIYNDKYQKF